MRITARWIKVGKKLVSQTTKQTNKKNPSDTQEPYEKVSLMSGDSRRLTNKVQRSKFKVIERKPLK